MKQNNMMLVNTYWGPTKTFSMIPINDSCPFVEVMYNPAETTLAIIGKTKKEAFHSVPRLNDDGDPELRKKATENNKYKMQRITQETYTEYYLTEKEDIKLFIETFGFNEASFNYKSILDIVPMAKEKDNGIIMPDSKNLIVT